MRGRDAGVLGEGDMAGVEVPDPVGPRVFGQVSGGAILDRTARDPGDPRTGRERLEMPDPTAAAGRPVEVHREVAELAGRAIWSDEQAALRDDGAADARGDGHVEVVVRLARRAERPLRQRGDLRVAVEVRGKADVGLDALRKGNVHELGAEVGRLDDDAAPGVDRAGRADGDADECGFGVRIVRPQLRAAGAQRLQAGPNDRLGTLRHGSVAGDARLDRAVRADRRGTDLRATQVEGQHRAARPPGLVTQLAPALRTSPRIEHSVAILANALTTPGRVQAWVVCDHLRARECTRLPHGIGRHGAAQRAREGDPRPGGAPAPQAWATTRP